MTQIIGQMKQIWKVAGEVVAEVCWGHLQVKISAKSGVISAQLKTDPSLYLYQIKQF